MTNTPAYQRYYYRTHPWMKAESRERTRHFRMLKRLWSALQTIAELCEVKP